ncbi:trehalase family glycosidase [Thermogutta sp.]|uniref:trehalase family glycosidase n=1 Tax=Thermogutta sp. TaxID=1962930 RepID=UPI003C7E3856
MRTTVLVLTIAVSATWRASGGFAEQGAQVPWKSASEAVTWLESQARNLVRECRRALPDGRAVFPPQVGIGYEAFWLRDYAYMLEGAADAFTEEELRHCLAIFLNAQATDGTCVDCVTFDGKPIFKPGMGTMGENPVADGSQFLVDVAYHTWKRVNDRELLRKILPRLEKALTVVPRNATSGLVWIDPEKEWDRCPYGFTDTVVKKGAVLFCSLLLYQSYQQMAEMESACGYSERAIGYLEEANRLAGAIRTILWDDNTGLFLAATHQCRQPDIWGSAFAVYLGVASSDQSKKIGSYFRDHYAEIVQKGKIRHLPGGAYWEVCKASPETYQNGGYWPVPTGWFVVALAQIDPVLAEKTLLDFAEDCHQRGFVEWANGDVVRLPKYVASATAPLPGFRQLLKMRR